MMPERDRMNLLEKILEMDHEDLLAYVTEQAEELEIEFDPDLLDGTGKQALYDFIVINIHTELQMELHSECREEDFDAMHPDETVEEFHDHED